MNFGEAMEAVELGKKVTRLEWPDGEFGFLQDDFLVINRNGIHRWLVTGGDLGAIDWVIVE